MRRRLTAVHWHPPSPSRSRRQHSPIIRTQGTLGTSKGQRVHAVVRITTRTARRSAASSSRSTAGHTGTGGLGSEACTELNERR
jgi:hypothetical protein